MNMQSFWERHRARRWPATAEAGLPLEEKPPEHFQPLTRDESITVLDDANRWIVNEARSTSAMPEGRAEESRWAELAGRDKPLVRDFVRLNKGHGG